MRSDAAVIGWRAGRGWKLAAFFNALATLASCDAESPHPAGSGSLAGQVVVSGPLRKARVSVDQLDYGAKTAPAIRAHVADTTTDGDGRFRVEIKMPIALYTTLKDRTRNTALLFRQMD